MARDEANVAAGVGRASRHEASTARVAARPGREATPTARRSWGAGPGAGGGKGARGGGRGAAVGTSAGAGEEGVLLSERDLRAIEKEHPDGITSVQVVDFFTRRGIRFSEATFRKYVQQGLLPRSRRVGRKGKHQGSLGLYPASTVRRINVIKRLQGEDYTIEEIQRQFLRFRDEIEALERSLETLFAGFEEELARPQFDPGARKAIKKDVGEAQLAAEELIRQLESIERRVAAPSERPPGGAPGGAEDLL